jgi:hypothetical protein
MNEAKLLTNRGCLKLMVLSYEFPESSEDYDRDWLVLQIKWSGSLAEVELTQPCLLAGELEYWANGLTAYLESNSQMGVKFEFIEPNIQMAVDKKGCLGCYAVNIDIYGEPAMIAEHFHVEAEADQSELRAFAQSLHRLSEDYHAKSQ